MQVTINGKPETFEGSTVLDILKAKEIDPHIVAIELNTQIVERDRIATTLVKEGDKLEFLFYMGGGA